MTDLPRVGTTVEVTYTDDQSKEEQITLVEVTEHTKSGTGILGDKIKVTGKGLVFVPSSRTGNRVKVGHNAEWSPVDE